MGHYHLSGLGNFSRAQTVRDESFDKLRTNGLWRPGGYLAPKHAVSPFVRSGLE